MVRLKNRYLLVNILYPELEKGPHNSRVPDIVTFHQPTTDEFDVHALLKGLRAAISNLFGDYGAGAVSDSLSGELLHLQLVSCAHDTKSNTYRPQHLPSYSALPVPITA